VLKCFRIKSRGAHTTKSDACPKRELIESFSWTHTAHIANEMPRPTTLCVKYIIHIESGAHYSRQQWNCRVECARGVFVRTTAIYASWRQSLLSVYLCGVYLFIPLSLSLLWGISLICMSCGLIIRPRRVYTCGPAK